MKHYIALTEAGRLYDHLMAEWQIDAGKRQEFKGSFFGEVLFCKDHTRYESGRRFADRYPNVMKAVADLKSRDYKQASVLLQRCEAALMMNRVVRRVMDEFPDDFVATVHDSLLCLSDRADDYQRVLRQEFGRVGLSPTIRREEYRQVVTGRKAG